MTTEKKITPSRSKLKYVLAVVFIILIIAALFLVPRYNHWQREKRAAEIRTALEAFRSSIDQAWKTAGSISGITVEGAVQDAGISQRVLDKWQFFVAWKLTDLYTLEMVNKLKDVNTNETVYVAPYKMIMAVATAKNPVGEGTKTWFMGDSNSYHGFGYDGKTDPDWSIIFPNP
jgi:type II secretory pathway pseudopilin PulG